MSKMYVLKSRTTTKRINTKRIFNYQFIDRGVGIILKVPHEFKIRQGKREKGTYYN